MEEQLLCAVVHEFGPNFAFAADVLGACSQLQGIFRRASQCREKFKQLTVYICIWNAHDVGRYGCMSVPQLHPQLILHLCLVIGKRKEKKRKEKKRKEKKRKEKKRKEKKRKEKKRKAKKRKAKKRLHLSA